MITIASYEHCELAYYVLSHLDLGRDAASLYAPFRTPTTWSEHLLRAYQQSSSRLEVQWAALKTHNFDSMCEALPNDEVGVVFQKALLLVLPGFRHDFQESRLAIERTLARARTNLLEPLTTLRSQLWSRPAPPLEIVHAPSLTVHGRAYGQGGNRRVAVNLDRPWGQALMQIFHEECHPVSDPKVMQLMSCEHRDTRAGMPGHPIHFALERAAIDLGRTVVNSAMPALVPAYQRFCGRYGM